MLSFSSSANLADAIASYTGVLKSAGWKATGAPGTTKSTTVLTFKKDGADLTISIRAASASITVRILEIDEGARR